MLMLKLLLIIFIRKLITFFFFFFEISRDLREFDNYLIQFKFVIHFAIILF